MRIPNMISTMNFANHSHAKIGAGTIMQEATPNMENLSSKWAPLKWVLILIKWICGLIHKFSGSNNLLSKNFFGFLPRLNYSGTLIFVLTQTIER